MTGRDQRQDRPIEDLEAANAFRDTLVPQADGYRAHAPLWHGWAVFDAFLAGMDHARQGLTRNDIESPHPDGRT
jgi:hypothetical protein